VDDHIRGFLAATIADVFLKTQEPTRYRWVHDYVQDAAMCFVGGGGMAVFRFRLGKWLLRSLLVPDLESNVFAIVYILNAAECPETEKVTVA
jgi:hypothetical protein